MTMRDCDELVTALHCCAENQCEICPRGDTQYGWIECKKKLTHDVTDVIEELVARNQEQEYVIRLLHIEKETLKTFFGR